MKHFFALASYHEDGARGGGLVHIGGTMLRCSFLWAFLAVLTSRQLNADIVYSIAGSTINIDFTGYAGAGFQAAPGVGQLDSDDWAVTGWSDGDLAFGGTRTIGDFARGTSNTAETTGGFYAFTSITPNTGTSFGIQPGGSDWAPGTLTLQIRNNTGFTLNSISFGYDLFVRNNEGRSSSFNFSYGVGALNTPPAVLTTSGINNDSYTSIAAADSNGWVNQRSAATLTTVGLTVNNGQSVFLRWSGADVGGSGFRDEFAIDNISFSAITAVPEPSSMALVGLMGGVATVWGWRKRRKNQVQGN